MIGGYFSPADRQQIAEMWAAYQPVSVIACALMVDPSTVHRELKLGNENGELDENKRPAYNPELAQLRFQENLRRRGRRKTCAAVADGKPPNKPQSKPHKGGTIP